MKAFDGANLALRFLLELGAVAATAAWGYETGSGTSRWLLALAAPAAVIIVWGLVIAPKAKIAAPGPLRLAIEFAVWAAAAGALAAIGEPALAVVFAVLAGASGSFNYVRRHDRQLAPPARRE